jgi:site-specific DNA-cytosine methylase
MSAYTHHDDCSIKDPCLRCKEFGATQERERIIALLETEAGRHGNPNASNMILLLIALIKGDDK